MTSIACPSVGELAHLGFNFVDAVHFSVSTALR